MVAPIMFPVVPDAPVHITVLAGATGAAAVVSIQFAGAIKVGAISWPPYVRRKPSPSKSSPGSRTTFEQPLAGSLGLMMSLYPKEPVLTLGATLVSTRSPRRSEKYSVYPVLLSRPRPAWLAVNQATKLPASSSTQFITPSAAMNGVEVAAAGARSTPSRVSYSTFGQKSVATVAAVMVPHPFALALAVSRLSRTRARRMIAFALGFAQGTVAVPPPLGPWAATWAPGRLARSGASTPVVGLMFFPVRPRASICFV